MRVALVLILALALCSCGDDSIRNPAKTVPSQASSPAWLKVLDESIFDSGDFSLIIDENPDWISVTVVGKSVSHLKALYLELNYDLVRLRFQESIGSPCLADLGQVLELSFARSEGILQHGQVLANWPLHDGFSGDGVLATYRFAVRAPGTKADSSKRICVVPASDKAAHWLNLNAKTSSFFWYYVNPGDYDQNGEVGISDLTPLGANFNAEGPFDVSSARIVIDGDGNQIINISDITPIGANFGNHIGSFAIYCSDDDADYPSSNSGANGPGAQLIGTRQFASGSGGGTSRRHWELTMEHPLLSKCYWLRPVSQGTEGTSSQLVTKSNPQWHVSEVLSYEPAGETVTAKGLSVAEIQGRPAAIFVSEANWGERDFLYLQSADPFGDSWNTPAVILSKDESFGNPSLAEVSGNPAFTMMSDLGAEALLYYRAANEEGTVWSLPVTVDTDTNPGIRSRLMMFEDTPVVVFSNGGDEVYIRIALDPLGGAWGDAQLFYSQAFVDLLDAMVTPTGVAAILTDYLDSYSVYYFRLDISGSTAAVFPGVELLPPHANGTHTLSIDIAGGKPYALVTRGMNREFVYTSSLDENGDTWSTAASLPLPDDVAQADATTVCGVPWVVYYTSADPIIRSARAAEPGSITWLEEAHVAEAVLGPKFISVLTASDHPAVMYADDIEKDLMFGIYY
jgi:hypothetical protein